jgi:hypothetical protein
MDDSQHPQQENTMKTLSIVCSAALALAAAAVMAKPPVDNISHHRHPNLAAAQRLSTQAYEKVVAAQRANEFDLDGHAQKAKELLDQANRELKQAAETSNANHH